MPDTWFTTSPDWTWWIVPYFFIGGIAGGAYVIAAMLDWFGRPADRPMVRLGYYIAVIGAAISAVLLILDLDRPLRFWHMLFLSEQFPRLAFKYWSPISVGSWALLLFGLFATLSALGALAEEDRIRWPLAQRLRTGWPGRLIALFGAFFGFFVAGYTGVLLTVTNRPIWADSAFLGMLFLVSAASTGAAALIVLARARSAPVEGSVHWLARFDGWLLVLELFVLAVFLISLGPVIRAWFNLWGVFLVLGVVLLGILVPLALHHRPGWFPPWLSARSVLAAAVLVLIGGLFLRMAVLLASHGISAFPISES